MTVRGKKFSPRHILIAFLIAILGTVAVMSFANPAGARTPNQTIADESGGNPGAVNTESGAAGICQVLPSTSAGVGGPSTSAGIVALGESGQRQLCEKVRVDAVNNGYPNPWAASGSNPEGSFLNGSSTPTDVPTAPVTVNTTESTPATPQTSESATPAADNSDNDGSTVLTTALEPQVRDDVNNVQTKLNERGANLTVDGQYGPLTEAAVMDFQSDNGLTVDGAVGAATLAALTS